MDDFITQVFIIRTFQIAELLTGNLIVGPSGFIRQLMNTNPSSLQIGKLLKRSRIPKLCLLSRFRNHIKQSSQVLH